MALSPTTYTRNTILTALKAAATVTARIPSARLYTEKTSSTPTKPFGRYGSATAEPDRYSCWSGGDVSGAYHIFVKADSALGIYDPGNWTGDTVDAITEVIDALPDCYVERTQVLPDPAEADVYHGIVFFRMKALTEA